MQRYNVPWSWSHSWLWSTKSLPLSPLQRNQHEISFCIYIFVNCFRMIWWFECCFHFDSPHPNQWEKKSNNNKRYFWKKKFAKDCPKKKVCWSRSLLAIQIDAAINPGNSGGPCFATASPAAGDASCMGVAFQVLGREDAENIGYIIPSEAMLDECIWMLLVSVMFLKRLFLFCLTCSMVLFVDISWDLEV